MTSKERLQTALAHRDPDRIPIDFGSTAVTGIHVSVVDALRTYFGLTKEPVKVHEPYQMLGFIEEDLTRAMGIDTFGIPARNTMFGFPNRNWREFRLPWGQVVLVPEQFVTVVDRNGDLLVYPEGDSSVPPSGRTPT